MADARIKEHVFLLYCNKKSQWGFDGPHEVDDDLTKTIQILNQIGKPTVYLKVTLKPSEGFGYGVLPKAEDITAEARRAIDGPLQVDAELFGIMGGIINAHQSTRRHGVTRCARCGQNHEWLEFKLFTRPIVDEDGSVWDRWATCPTTGDPILATDISGDASSIPDG